MLIFHFVIRKYLCSLHDPSLTINVIENNSYERTLGSFCYSVGDDLSQNALHLLTLDLLRFHQVGEKLLSGINGLSRGQKYQLEVAGLVEFPPGLLVLDLEDAIVDVAAGFFVDDAANPAKMFHKVLGALVGIILGVGHGVVGERVDDGDSGVLNRPPLTVVLSMAKENIMSNQILAQRDIPTCLFSNIITHLPTLHFFSCSS